MASAVEVLVEEVRRVRSDATLAERLTMSSSSCLIRCSVRLVEGSASASASGAVGAVGSVGLMGSVGSLDSLGLMGLMGSVGLMGSEAIVRSLGWMSEGRWACCSRRNAFRRLLSLRDIRRLFLPECQYPQWCDGLEKSPSGYVVCDGLGGSIVSLGGRQAHQRRGPCCLLSWCSKCGWMCPFVGSRKVGRLVFGLRFSQRIFVLYIQEGTFKNTKEYSW